MVGMGWMEALRVSMEPPAFDVIKLSVGRPIERMRSSCGVCVWFCLVVFCLVGVFLCCCCFCVSLCFIIIFPKDKNEEKHIPQIQRMGFHSGFLEPLGDYFKQHVADCIVGS